MLKIPSRKQIADALDVTPETATKFLKSAGISNRILNSADVETLRKNCHPLFFQMSREKLAKIYRRHPETLASDLKEIGIDHQSKLSFTDLQNIYWKLGLPDWILPFGIQNVAPARTGVKKFYSQIGVTMTEKWYDFYYKTLGTADIVQSSESTNSTELQYVWNAPR
ncbi:MAG TPA: hypothetical protein VK658_04605 [Chryseolinea sp.]|nr:hypothetical protein [Chryseolinea sp.]